MLQLFVEIVSQAAHFFRVLFNPYPLYLHETLERQLKFKQLYCRGYPQNLSDEEKDWFDQCITNTWASYDKLKGNPVWSMVSNTLLDELDKLNGEILDPLDLFTYWYEDEDDEKKTEFISQYWTKLEELLMEHIKDNDELVAKLIPYKLRWYRQAATFFDRLCIPILTPKMLDALATHISVRAKAYEEVSPIPAFKECLKACPCVRV